MKSAFFHIIIFHNWKFLLCVSLRYSKIFRCDMIINAASKEKLHISVYLIVKQPYVLEENE